MKKKTTKCPACGKIFVMNGIKNHVVNMAKSEIWNNSKLKPHKELFDKYKFKSPSGFTLAFSKIE